MSSRSVRVWHQVRTPMFLHAVMQRDEARAKFNCTCIARAGPRHASTNLYHILVVCLLARLFLVLLAPSGLPFGKPDKPS